VKRRNQVKGETITLAPKMQPVPSTKAGGSHAKSTIEPVERAKIMLAALVESSSLIDLPINQGEFSLPTGTVLCRK
jgi:hypothetical protein